MKKLITILFLFLSIVGFAQQNIIIGKGKLEGIIYNTKSGQTDTLLALYPDSLGQFKIMNVKDPVNDLDAVNLRYFERNATSWDSITNNNVGYAVIWQGGIKVDSFQVSNEGNYQDIVYISYPDKGIINISGGTGDTIPIVNEVDAGLMTPTYKAILDSAAYYFTDSVYSIQYGALYNFWAATDERKISSSDDWIVPTNTDFVTLRTYIASEANNYDGTTTLGTNSSNKQAMAVASVYEDWFSTAVVGSPGNNTSNDKRNITGFKARPSGFRDSNYGGMYTDFVAFSSVEFGTEAYTMSLGNNYTSLMVLNGYPKQRGLSVRLIYAGAGTPTSYTGNNGIVYDVIQIGSQFWLAESLNETKYRNGDWITGFDGGVYTPMSGATWAAKTTEAMCYYDDTESYGGTLEQELISIAFGDTINFSVYVPYSVYTPAVSTINGRLDDLEGLDTTGVYHLNRALLDAISEADTTRWGTGDNWGTQSVVTDNTLTGIGITGNTLKVDTTKIATPYDLTLKQDILTNPVTGTGTQNYVSKFTSTGSIIGNSQIFDNGTNVGIGTTPSEKLEVAGKTKTTTFQMTTSPGVNLFMKSDAIGNGGWGQVDTTNVSYLNEFVTIRTAGFLTGNIDRDSTNELQTLSIDSTATTYGISLSDGNRISFNKNTSTGGTTEIGGNLLLGGVVSGRNINVTYPDYVPEDGYMLHIIPDADIVTGTAITLSINGGVQREIHEYYSHDSDYALEVVYAGDRWGLLMGKGEQTFASGINTGDQDLTVIESNIDSLFTLFASEGATDLSVSGNSSAVSINSSTGTGISVSAGTNASFGSISSSGFTINVATGDSTSYPGEGIALSTGSAWGTSITNNSANWNTAYNDKINSLAFSGTTTKTLTLTQQDGTTLTGNFTDNNSGGTVTSISLSVPTGLDVTTFPITTSGTFNITLQSGYSIPTIINQTNWTTAYTDRLKWDGGATGLVAATGRTSLGGTTIGQAVFTSLNPSADRFGKANADNTFSWLTAADFKTALGITGTVSSIAMTVPTGLSVAGSPITTAGTLALTFQSGYSIPTDDNQALWTTAYNDRNKWDGGATGLVAATGRTSLGGTTIGQAMFTSANPSAIRFGRANADNTFSWLTAADFRTAIGAGSAYTGSSGILLTGSNFTFDLNGLPLMSGASIVDADYLTIHDASVGGNYKVLMSGLKTYIGAGTYSLPLAANGTRGGLQIGYTSTANNFALQLSSEKAYTALPDATTSVKGIASFSTTNFSASAGAVSIKTGGVSSANIADKGATTQILYNNGGTISGTANLTTNGTNVTVAGHVISDATRVQALNTNSSTVTFDALNGFNAIVTVTSNTNFTFSMSNLTAGTTGNITIVNTTAGGAITLSGYTNKVAPSIYVTTNIITTSGSSKIDSYSWYYDGSRVLWNGAKDYR